MVSPGSSEPFSAVKNQSLRATSVPLSQNVKQVDKPAVADFPDVVQPEPLRDQQQVQRHASFEMARSVNFAKPSAVVSTPEPESSDASQEPGLSEPQTQQFLAQVKSAQEQGYGAVDADQMQQVFQTMGIPMAKDVAIAAAQMTEVFSVPIADISSLSSSDDLEARLQSAYANLMSLNPGSNLQAPLSPEQRAQKTALLSEVESLRKQLADRISQQVLSAQTSGSELDARRLGFEGAMAAIGHLDQGSGLTEAMQRIATGESLEGIQLNTQGASNVALNLLQRIQPGLQTDGSLGFNTQKTQQIRQEMDKIANWSRELLEGRLPAFSPQDLQLLSELGIGFSNGKLVNAGDGQELSTEVVRNLGHLATCTGIALSSTGGLTPANVAMRDFLTKLTTAQSALDQAAKTRDQLTLLTEQVELTTEEVHQQTQVVDTTTLQLDTKRQQATVLADDLAVTSDETTTDEALPPPVMGSTALPPEGDASVGQSRRGRRKHERIPFWERPDPTGRKAEALGRMGLSVTGTPGQPRQFFVDNRAVDEDTFTRELAQRRQAGFGRLAVLQQDIQTLGVLLRRQRQDLDASTLRLERERRQLQATESQYKQDVATANEATTDLEHFSNSPAWNLLPPEFQASAGPLVHGVRTQMDQENALAPKVLARSQAADQRAEGVIQRAHTSLQMSALALQRADDLDARLAVQLAARDAHSQAGAEIRAEVALLVNEADRLQAELELMSTPHYVGVEKLFESWRVSLAEVQHIFQRLANEQMMADAQDALTTRVNTDRMREGLAYHQKQLEQLDQQQKARMVEVLSQSSDWLKQTLPALALAS